jgi:hypothetical protein
MPRIIKSQVNDNISELNIELRDTFYSLPVSILRLVQEDLQAELSWPYSTFYVRMRGTRPVRAIEIPHIKKVFAKYGIQIFNNN